MARILYDSSGYHKAKALLPPPDGKTCIIPGCGKPLPPYRRKYCSDECFSTWYFSLVKSWAATKSAVIKRDGSCQDCGRPYKGSENFEVHHIKQIRDGGDEFDPDNCILLCQKCHKRRHKKRSSTLNHRLDKWMI